MQSKPRKLKHQDYFSDDEEEEEEDDFASFVGSEKKSAPPPAPPAPPKSKIEFGKCVTSLVAAAYVLSLCCIACAAECRQGGEWIFGRQLLVECRAEGQSAEEVQEAVLKRRRRLKRTGNKAAVTFIVKQS